MSKQIITRNEARALGLSRYHTGEPCKRGHISERYVSTAQCVTCQLAHSASRADKKDSWRATHQGEIKAYGVRYYQAHRDAIRAAQAAYRAANPEKIRASKVAYRARLRAERTQSTPTLISHGTFSNEPRRT
jgi:hypothetical protein